MRGEIGEWYRGLSLLLRRWLVKGLPIGTGNERVNGIVLCCCLCAEGVSRPVG